MCLSIERFPWQLFAIIAYILLHFYASLKNQPILFINFSADVYPAAYLERNHLTYE